MLNRIINGVDGVKKKEYLDLYDFVINSPNFSDEVKNSSGI